MTMTRFRRRIAGFVLCALAASVAVASAHADGLSASDLFLLNRVTWGANEQAAAALQSMGREAWLQHQLHPGPEDRLPEQAQAQIDALAVSRTPMPELLAGLAARNREVNQIQDPAEKAPAAQAYQQAMTDTARQAAARSILRDLYSPSQLREQMTWFWFNHFNVHQYKNDIRPMLADYEETAIRPHALGRFRDLLAASLRHPAMLVYLDNAANARGRINENYAREIMELHTMGVGGGYSQQDVQALAQILTGLGIDTKPDNPKLKPEWQAQLVRDGLFEFNPVRHDYADKIFLGHTIQGSGLAEVDQALDLITRSPATADRLSRKMAVFFMGDDPPQGVIRQMSETFQRTDGDIAAVLDTLFHAPEFTDGHSERFKDPVHFVLSSLRLAYDTRVIANTLPVQGMLNRMGEGLYNKDTPDGYPLGAAAWSSPGQLAIRFEVARQIGSSGAGLFKPDTPGAVDQPGFPQLQNALYFDRLRHSLTATTAEALSQAVSPQDWNTLYLSSPEFMY